MIEPIKRDWLCVASRRSEASEADTNIAADLLTAIVEMINEVRKAFDQEPQEILTAADKRERYAAALEVIAIFLGKCAGEKYAARLFELGSGLGDLNKGSAHPLFEPAAKTSRRPDPSFLWRAKVNVVLAIEALLATGRSPSDAAAEVLGIFPRRNRPRGISQKGFLEWRKIFRAGHENFEAAELFSVGCKKIDCVKDNLAELENIARNRANAALRVLSPPVKPR